MARLSRTPQRGFDVGIKHIRAVNSVALYGSFTAAAADLGMTQSAVSRLVLQLEKQLGVSLFLRSTRNVVLTAPGREFTASTRRFIEDLNIQVENTRALGGQIRGRLIISCLLSITHHVVPDAVLKYRGRFRSRKYNGTQSGSRRGRNRSRVVLCCSSLKTQTVQQERHHLEGSQKRGVCLAVNGCRLTSANRWYCSRKWSRSQTHDRCGAIWNPFRFCCRRCRRSDCSCVSTTKTSSI